MNERKESWFGWFFSGFVSALVLVLLAWGFWSFVVGFAHFACAVITS